MNTLWKKNYPIPILSETDVVHPSPCADCGGTLVAKQQGSGRWWYNCVTPGCYGNVSADEAGRPLGIPIDADGRRKRMEAHDLFDPMWMNTRGNDMMSMYRVRDALYTYLGLYFEDPHIGRLNHEQLDKLLILLKDGSVERYMKFIMGIDIKEA